MKKYLFLLCLWPLLTWGQADYRYQVDLQNVSRDRVSVSLDLSRPAAGELTLQFPKTVPGTYAELDYGRFVKNLRAYDAGGKRLSVKKLKPNRFVIAEGNRLARITYDFQDSWEHGGKPKIFEPAGCGFEAGEYFAINGGMFGYLAGEEEKSFDLTFLMPYGFRGYGSLPSETEGVAQTFHAPSYHAVIDHPLLFTAQEPQTLSVAGTEVLIAAHVVHDSASFVVNDELEQSMVAIEKFVGETPVDRYAYLIYFQDQSKAGAILEKASQKGKLGLGAILRLLPKLAGQGFGALEHGTSSMYFMPAFDDENYASGLEEVAIHEFMHIYAPLSLHSQFIGDFDYVDPTMSQHLWLYEGCTEYFAGLIQQQGELVSLPASLQNNWRGKIQAGSSYPDSIPFTEMSANVFDDPYEALYGHVYDRGAIMAMLLDFEIMRLTDGAKTLKDVIFTLSERYGADQSFDEESFFDTFVDEVHPDLMTFFDRYVRGGEPLDLEGGFRTVGIRYADQETGSFPVDLLGRAQGVKALASLADLTNELVIAEAEPDNPAGFQPGDVLLDPEAAELCFYDPATGRLRPEGSEATLKVRRDGQPVTLRFELPFAEDTRRYVIEPLPRAEMSEQQAKLFDLWVQGKR